MASTKWFLFVAIMTRSLPVSHAIDFLAAQQRGTIVAKEVLEQMLLLELPSSANKVRLDAVKQRLSSTFASLPKNQQGQLEPSTVRYVLHRYFVQQHGWSVKGLDPEGGGLNASASAASQSGDVMKGLAPAYIQDLFTERLHGRGLDLEELAVFAATMSDLVFQESLGGLRGVYEKLMFSTDERLPEPKFDLGVRAYLSDLITAEYGNFTGPGDLKQLEEQARGFFPEYDDIVMWSRDLYHSQEFFSHTTRNPFGEFGGVSFDRAATFLLEFVGKFGKFLESDCRVLKDELLTMEKVGNGRVLLSDFYQNRNLQMHESFDYLRNLGVLETDGGAPRLIISNYVTSPSRCTPFSSYYSVCCPDECDSLLGSLERDIGKPAAEPTRIAGLVAELPSDTVEAPRNLSALMTSRLNEIASHHGGLVPLHGRLFLQWMHHAFPRECTYPHAAGTTQPVSQDEWLAQNLHLQDAMVNPVERLEHVTAKFSVESTDFVDLPWSSVEELVANHSSEPSSSWIATARFCVCVVALLSFAVPLVRASAVVSQRSGGKEIHFV